MGGKVARTGNIIHIVCLPCSSVDFQSMDNSHRDGMVEVAIVRADSTHDIGFTEDGRDRPVYCCDERLLSLGVPGCTQVRLVSVLPHSLFACTCTCVCRPFACHGHLYLRLPLSVYTHT